MAHPSDPVRMAAIDEYFRLRRTQVPVLAQRASDEGVTEIRHLEDVVPLLFPHTTYKSYPEQLVTHGRWAGMCKWLDSLSTHRVDDVDLDGVVDVDDWMAALERAGHFATSSSGTSGKASFLNKTAADREATLGNLRDSLVTAGIALEPKYHLVPAGPDTGQSHHDAVRQVFIDSLRRPDSFDLKLGGPVGGHHGYMSRLAGMRRAMAEGTALPDEIAEFEAEMAARAKANDDRQRFFAEQIIERRDEDLFFNAMFPMLFALVGIVREMGAQEGDFTGTNGGSAGGGLKGSVLPPDFKDQIFAMFNLADDRFLHYYSMQELNVRTVKCVAGRYHLPEPLTILVLDQEGEALAEMSGTEVEGRAAFVDVTVDGRWGGTISGDKVHVDYGVCACGRPGPGIDQDINRFSALGDDDKITCAGTMDAYVRGFVGE